jgi:YVTN family beta-propeller protein
MADVRTATVTLLFTDIEGSTRLLRQLGRRYGEVLAKHERLLHEVFAAHGGQEIDTQGDSFFVAFESAGDAVAATVDAQRALAEHAWPEGVAVRVRMGLHSGRASVQEKRYLGVAVHRAARICAAGHGGQVLLSETVRHLVEDEEDDLPAIEFVDLGEQRLKDFDRPVRVYQVVADGLERDFPPLQTAERPPDRGSTPLAADEIVAPAESRRRRRVGGRRAAIVSAALVAGAIPVIWLLAERGGSQPALTSVPPNSVAVIDPGRNELVADVPVGSRPTSIAVAPTGVWVGNDVDRTVSRIDPASHAILRTIPVAGHSLAVAAGRDAAWVAAVVGATDARLTLTRIDTQYYELRPLAAIDLGSVQGFEAYVRPAVALGGDSGWFAAGDRVARFDPAGSLSSARVRLAFTAGHLAAGVGSLWVVSAESSGGGDTYGTLARVSPETNTLADTTRIGNGASVDVGFGAVWVTSTSGDTVTRVDPETLTPIATIHLPLGSFPTDIAVGEDAVWVVNRLTATVSRIDPKSNDVVATVHVGGHPEGIAAGEGHGWVTVQ